MKQKNSGFLTLLAGKEMELRAEMGLKVSIVFFIYSKIIRKSFTL